ncbi:MAG: cysteine desulfurase, partial [Planctomycetota bacterium]
MSPDPICEAAYLDNNATSPVAEEVIAAMLPWFRAEPGNPSSLHGPGERAHAAISKARKQVAELLGARSPKQVHFTSGGTESINSALFSALASGSTQGRNLAITSTVEHPATTEYLVAMAKSGAWATGLEARTKLEVTTIPVDAEGRLEVQALLDLLSDQGERCSVVSLLLVNNETGHILSPDDIRAIGDAAHRVGAMLHLDAVQAAGKLSLQLADLPVDFASISGHKLHGPKGTGALYVRGETFHSLLHGGPQESERRAGTENVPGIVGLGEAAALARAYVASPEAMAKTTGRRDQLEQALLAA